MTDTTERCAYCGSDLVSRTDNGIRDCFACGAYYQPAEPRQPDGRLAGAIIIGLVVALTAVSLVASVWRAP